MKSPVLDHKLSRGNTDESDKKRAAQHDDDDDDDDDSTRRKYSTFAIVFCEVRYKLLVYAAEGVIL